MGCTSRTIWNWMDKEELRYHQKDKGKNRYFVWKEVVEDLKLQGTDEKKKITIGYCRVSTTDQKQDLEYQKKMIEMYCCSKGYNFQIIEDLGSGLNYNRKGLLTVLKYTLEKSIDRIVVSYKDRLMRFGFELFKTMCDENDVELEIINSTEEETYEQELVNDVLSIITVFSSKLYGKRSHKNKSIIDNNKHLWKI